jgi:hypothetical protein
LGERSDAVHLPPFGSRGSGDRPHGPEPAFIKVQVHFIRRDEISEKLHGPPHGDLDFQTAAYLNGRPAEEIIFVNTHGFFLLNGEGPPSGLRICLIQQLWTELPNKATVFAVIGNCEISVLLTN